MNPYCKVEGCGRGRQTLVGYCVMHYKRWKRNGVPERVLREYHVLDFCETPGCGRKPQSKGLCRPCAVQKFRKGTTERTIAPKGAGTINKDGYRVLTVNGEREYEHRVIARPKPGEVVHHKDGNRSNNELSNLEILPSQSAHMKIHYAEGKAFGGRNQK